MQFRDKMNIYIGLTSWFKGKCLEPNQIIIFFAAQEDNLHSLVISVLASQLLLTAVSLYLIKFLRNNFALFYLSPRQPCKKLLCNRKDMRNVLILLLHCAWKTFKATKQYCLKVWKQHLKEHNQRVCLLQKFSMTCIFLH